MCANQMDTTLPFDVMNRQPIQRDAKIAVSVCIYVIRSLDGGVLKNIFRLAGEVAIRGITPFQIYLWDSKREVRATRLLSARIAVKLFQMEQIGSCPRSAPTDLSQEKPIWLAHARYCAGVTSTGLTFLALVLFAGLAGSDFALSALFLRATAAFSGSWRRPASTSEAIAAVRWL